MPLTKDMAKPTTISKPSSNSYFPFPQGGIICPASQSAMASSRHNMPPSQKLRVTSGSLRFLWFCRRRVVTANQTSALARASPRGNCSAGKSAPSDSACNNGRQCHR